ncbi:hypothetical protein E4U31_007200 [Claviceps sp. LM219 group G6]|nr:hypothetical protein E4U31_007200 [Claviceps sp. LM219 group G6]
MMAATTAMKHLQKTTTIPSDRFTLRKTMPLNASHMKKIIRARLWEVQWNVGPMRVANLTGEYSPKNHRQSVPLINQLVCSHSDTEQPELDRLRIKWVPRSAVESNDHIHTVILLEILSIIGRPDLERPYQNWIFHSRNQ